MSHTLLLADDSVTIQRVIELTFADEDVTVVAVGDGNQAVARLDATPPDIVLADVDMPGRDGYAVARHVRDTPALSRIPVLLLTGAFDPVDEAAVNACGAAGVLIKPFEPQHVIARVRELLQNGASKLAAPAPAAAAAPASAEPALAAEPAPDAEPAPVSTTASTSPAEAASSSPPTVAIRVPPASSAATVEDYFQRLDRAFADLDVPLQPDDPFAGLTAPPPPAPPKSLQDTGRFVPAQLAAAAKAEAAAAGTPAATKAGVAGLSMADAFGALLGMEHGQPAPILPQAAPVFSEELVEQVARKVNAEISERLIREIAPAIVSEVAERIVREEIERIKQSVLRGSH